MIKFCCEILEETFSNTGKDGFAISVKRYSLNENILIYLQSRVEVKKEEYHHIFVNEQVIRYCPWCGKKLSKLIKNQKDWDELLLVHKKFELGKM
jgi:hypothetical protein